MRDRRGFPQVGAVEQGGGDVAEHGVATERVLHAPRADTVPGDVVEPVGVGSPQVRTGRDRSECTAAQCLPQFVGGDAGSEQVGSEDRCRIGHAVSVAVLPVLSGRSGGDRPESVDRSATCGQPDPGPRRPEPPTVETASVEVICITFRNKVPRVAVGPIDKLERDKLNLDLTTDSVGVQA